MATDIGKRIAELRRGKGISQEQLSEMALLSRVTIAKYESGRVEPGAQAIRRIADALEVSTDVLLGRDELPEYSNHERWMISECLRRDPEMRTLFAQAKNAKPEHIRAAVAVLKALEGEQDE